MINNEKDIKKEDVICVVVGNKIDLKNSRQITTEEGKNFAKKYNFIFAEVSAKTGVGIKELFEKKIIPKINKKFNPVEKNNRENLDINNKEEAKTVNFSYTSCLKKYFFYC